MVPVPVPMPMPMPNAALVLCFFITAVWPSDEISSGSWTFNEKTVCQWIGQTLSVDNSYSRAELFTNNGSLLLKLVNKYDSGEYQVNMVPTKGSQTSATITLQVTGAMHNPDLMETAVRSAEEHLKLLKCLLCCRCYCAIENLQKGRPQILGFAYCLLLGLGSKRSAEIVLGVGELAGGSEFSGGLGVGLWSDATSASLWRWWFTVCMR
ncbi:uncharacterized protein LOC134345912 isoform X2 [Mobula hypostoma]|uniref:uncharacterized protein LOC134345912 isoform X2 n=1 Tax=Mobula hypostoma TaxID=723540 RepID=UPI002FC383FF